MWPLRILSNLPSPLTPSHLPCPCRSTLPLTCTEPCRRWVMELGWWLHAHSEYVNGMPDPWTTAHV